jgi:hypothetical protein
MNSFINKCSNANNYYGGVFMNNQGKIINAESLNIDSTLEEVSQELKLNEILILDVGNNYFNQTDTIYDTLVLKGFDVRKTFKNGRNQIVVTKRRE